MRRHNQIDLGSVQVHKLVIAEIVQTAMEEVKGARLIDKDLLLKLKESFGYKEIPGVDVTVSDAQEVTIDVKIVLEYGKNIPDMARILQDAIRTALERTVEINLKDINVNIHGIERGQK